MTKLLDGFIQIIGNTPFFVWVILVILIVRGVSMMKDSVVSLGKTCIMPTIFILWGMSSILSHFQFRLALLLTYFVFLILGSLVSLLIYRNNELYKKDGNLMQEGSILPLVIVLLNFIVKYCLNVLLAILPALYTSLLFNLIYGLICGFTVGLFFGKIIRIIKAQSSV